MVNLIPEGRRKVVGRKCLRCHVWWLNGDTTRPLGCEACSATAMEIGYLTQGEIDDDVRSDDAIRRDDGDFKNTRDQATAERKAFRHGYNLGQNYACGALGRKLKDYDLEFIDKAIYEVNLEAALKEPGLTKKYHGEDTDV